MRRLSCITLVCCALFAAGAAQDNAAKKDLDALQGDWQALSVEIDGKAQPDDEVKSVKLTFQGDKITSINKNVKHEATVKLDPSKKPKTMDVMPLSGGDAGNTQLGVYSIEGDKLIICGGKGDAKVRPADLKAGKEIVRIVLQRVKSEKK